MKNMEKTIVVQLKSGIELKYGYRSSDPNGNKNLTGLDHNIILSGISKKNGIVKGTIEYIKLANYWGTGKLRMPFTYAIDGYGYMNDWTYENGDLIPYTDYIAEVLKILDQNKQLNK